MPFIIPAMGEKLDIQATVDSIDGLLLTGGRANVEPHHYGGPPFPDDEPIDPARDGVVLPLVRACIEQEVPIFGICRGIQEMNVALGGSLHYRVHLLPGKDDHRMPRHPDVTMEEVFKLRHNIALTDGGLFAELTGKSKLMVNSLHGQGIDRLADDFVLEAITEDGVIEGIRLANDPTFTVGVQARGVRARKWLSANSSKRSAMRRAIQGKIAVETIMQRRVSSPSITPAVVKLPSAPYVSGHKTRVLTSQKRCDGRDLIRCSITF